MLYDYFVKRQDEAGFTLIELVVTVALVGVLAAIAIPAFTGESRKIKAESEVSPMFAEISVRQEQYKLENGAYLSCAAYPGTPTPSLQTWGTPAAATGWPALRFQPPSTQVRCTYTAVAGAAGTAPAAGQATTLFNFTGVQARAWFYVLAQCNLDGTTGADDKDSWFFMSSTDGVMQKKYTGR